MEAYPPEYIEHNLPLVILSGLGERASPDHDALRVPRYSGTKINIVSPECSGDRADSLLHQFQQFDGSGLPWNASSLSGSGGNLKYRIRAIGRNYVFPSRKAAPLPQSPSTEGAPSVSAPRSELHSPLSPLSPGSPIFPDGLMTPLWLAKHQHHVPSLFLAFFSIDASGTADSDEQIKSDINAIRTALSRSGFKPRFAAVLLSDKSILSAPQLEERLSSVRRLTSLDSKTGLFFMPPMSSQGEIATFAHSIMAALQPSCLEYYRDLTKHARRKKTKSGTSTPSVPPGLEIKPLSTAGWSIRYEMKQGVFAEFRQEMDVAERHYSIAIDEICAPEGPFETNDPSSPRWKDARLLCDSLAIRVLRCQLWTSQTTGAAQSWINYRLRIKALLERKDTSLKPYDMETWEARWAEVMSQLIQRADLQIFQLPSAKEDKGTAEPDTLQIYSEPEKAFVVAERLPPFQALHHAGYWLRLATHHFRANLRKALAVTGQEVDSTSSQTGKLASSGDRGYADLTSLSQASIEQFVRRGQTRLSDFMTLELAHDLIYNSHHDEALQILRPLWEASIWRNEDWHDIFIDLLLTIRECAEHLQDRETTLATTYELMSVSAPISPDVSLSLIDNIKRGNTSDFLSLSFRDRQRLCPISISFAFKDSKTHVGDSLHCQLVVTSHAQELSGPLNISILRVQIGTSKTVVLSNSSENTTNTSELTELGELMEGDDGVLPVTTDLYFVPGQRRVFSFHLIFRESAVFRVTQATIVLSNEHFTIEHAVGETTLHPADTFYLANKEGTLDRVVASHAHTTSVQVLPKPPKVKMAIMGHKHEYYAGENIRLIVQLKNHEVESIEGSISASLSNESEDAIPLIWANEKNAVISEEVLKDLRHDPVHESVPLVPTKASHQVVLYAKAPTHPIKAEVLIDLKYSLTSDKTTPLWKSLAISINVALPFDGKYNFGPLFSAGAWPSYFDPGPGPDVNQKGIPQAWRLGCKVQSLVSQPIVVHDVQSLIDHVAGDSDVTAKRSTGGIKQTFKSGHTETFDFELSTQKHSLDDRRPTGIESSLTITWSRDEKDEQVTTHLNIPRLTLPVSEPRVLCTVSQPSADDDCDAVLQYHIENPSTHFLTFAISMEATEYFAFSGPKMRTLSLAPLSRYRVEYQIMLQEQDAGQSTIEDGGRWIWPMLQVTDSFYHKTLRVHPGGVGVRADEKQDIGVLVKRS